MDDERIDLGRRDDIDALAALVSLQGLDLVDVGCGPGLTSRELAARGATVLAVEPDPIQAGKNRDADPVEGLRFVQAGAECLPVADASVDGVLFFRSLHHVPIDLIDAALHEAARILKPETGFLCVAEPGITGRHFAVMRPFHDETRVRAAAQESLGRISRRLFREEAFYHYEMLYRYASFEALADHFLGTTFNDIRRENVENDTVRALFESGLTAQGDYAFDQPMLLNLYRGPKC